MTARVSMAISTLGRPSIVPLLESLVVQEQEPFEVAIADQGSEGFVQSAVEPFTSRLRIIIVPSPRGVAIGRNLAARALSDCDAIYFTDDDCVLAPDAVRRAAAEMLGDTDICTGRVVSSLGERGQSRELTRRTLDRRSVWSSSLESNMMFSASAFTLLNGFDEQLGVGAATPWQSGEGTEIMIRAIDAGMRIVHAPDIIVYEDSPPVSLRELSVKTRRYARGTGRVYAMHYSLGAHIRVVLRPAAGAVLRLVQGRFAESRLLLNASLGRLSTLPSRRFEVGRRESPQNRLME